MNAHRLVTLWVTGSLLATPAMGWAERRELQAFPPDRPSERQVVRPGASGNGPHPAARQLYEPAAALAPAFVAPLTKRTETGRAGIAGWSVPNPSIGSPGPGEPEGGGWVGFGFATQWGHPSGPRRN